MNKTNKYFFISIFFAFFSLISFSQAPVKPLHSLVLIKTINDNGKRLDKSIEIDSSGNIFFNKKKQSTKINMRHLSKEIHLYIIKEAVKKVPGNNNISFVEYLMPEYNQQNISLSIQFLDDFYVEKELRNKTHYSWNKNLNINSIDYPIFKYLTKKEIKILKNLLLF